MTDRNRTTTASWPSYRLPAGIKRFLVLLLSAAICLIFADIDIVTRTPWLELSNMLEGLLRPEFLSAREIIYSLAQTVSYAILAVCLAAVAGFILSLYYHKLWLRVGCVLLRSVHELFWGLLFIQLFGIHPIAGLLAIALPYSGIFAKVLAEIREEQQAPLLKTIVAGSVDRYSHFFYTQWPRLWPHFSSYIRYRMECGIRSSTILGFIGLPTLGFHLETAFMQGIYNQAAGILLIIIALIASLRYWLRLSLLPLYLIVALLVIGGFIWPQPSLQLSALSGFIHDITPLPLRNQEAILPWLWPLVIEQVIPGVINTLLVTQIALIGTAVIALALFPVISTQFFAAPIRAAGHLTLVVLRSTPELVIAFALLLLWGPSMLPAIAALAIHNGAIIAHLIGQHSQQISLRLDASHRLNRYGFEILPRIYGQFLAFLCYRWEVILRESAILGILGIHTLGFYIDSAFESFRLDVALLLIAVSAVLNIAVDQLSRLIRHHLHLRTAPQTRTPAPL